MAVPDDFRVERWAGDKAGACRDHGVRRFDVENPAGAHQHLFVKALHELRDHLDGIGHVERDLDRVDVGGMKRLGHGQDIARGGQAEDRDNTDGADLREHFRLLHEPLRVGAGEFRSA